MDILVINLGKGDPHGVGNVLVTDLGMTIQKTAGLWMLGTPGALANADLYDGVVPVPVSEAGEVLRQLGQVQTLLVPGGRRGGTGEGGSGQAGNGDRQKV